MKTNVQLRVESKKLKKEANEKIGEEGGTKEKGIQYKKLA
jgi:hypothetical protein